MRRNASHFSILHSAGATEIAFQCSCIWEGARPAGYVSDLAVLEFALDHAGGDIPAVQKQEEVNITNNDESEMLYDLRLPLTPANLRGVFFAGYTPDETVAANCDNLMTSDPSVEQGRAAVQEEVVVVRQAAERLFRCLGEDAIEILNKKHRWWSSRLQR